LRIKRGKNKNCLAAIKIALKTVPNEKITQIRENQKRHHKENISAEKKSFSFSNYYGSV